MHIFAIHVGQCQELIPLPDAKWRILSEKDILPTRTSERFPFKAIECGGKCFRLRLSHA